MNNSSQGINGRRKSEKNSRLKYLEYLFFRLQRGFISVLPFRLMYIYSDLIGFVLHRIVRYRLATVKENLRNSFPGKNEQEFKSLIKGFYRNLADITVESIKGYSMSTEQLQGRYVIKNPEIANKYYSGNRDVILALSHYGNWEWGSQIAPAVFSHSLVAFYKPLTNKYMDKYLIEERSKRNLTLVPTDKPRLTIRLKQDQPAGYFFINDQFPGHSAKVFRTRFLNQDTRVSKGLEVYARLFNMPVIYLKIERIKRGYYVVELEEIDSDPVTSKLGEITEKYMRNLEKQIIARPENWLWSHRRWKN